LPPFLEASPLFRGSNGALPGAQGSKQLVPDAPPLGVHGQTGESRPASGCGPFLNVPVRELHQSYSTPKLFHDHTSHA
jgi:hypothetical protein